MDILITTPLHNRRGFYTALSARLCPDESPITNADALADVLRSNHVEHVVASDWQLDLREELVLLAVFKDLGITLRFA